MAESEHDAEAREAETLMAAAMQLWEPLARFAWTNGEAVGKGVVLADRADLLSAAAGATPTDALSLTFVPATHIPQGDDFRSVIEEHDPTRQVALLVGGRGDSEHLLVVEPSGDDRAAPPDC